MILARDSKVCGNRSWLQILTVFLMMAAAVAQQQSPIEYRLKYSGTADHRVQIHLSLPEAVAGTSSFVMPRNYPGGYSLVPYDSFVENLRAISASGKMLGVDKEPDGPRWRIKSSEDPLRRIEYEIDIERMERELPAAIDTSKARDGYLGVLGYSVFGYVDRLQQRNIKLQVEGPRDWPVLSTLAPAVPAANGNASAETRDYYTLADSQILMGPKLHFELLKGKISIVMAVYSEGEADLSAQGQLAREALDNVQAYFGNAPFPVYTVQLELLRPLAGHKYGFSQEHINSGTFTLPTAEAITNRSSVEDKQVTLLNYAHHMAHCWIPKRSYGTGYLPFTWEMPPLIDTIWFNEGFARYAAIAALAEAMPAAQGTEFRERQLQRLRHVLDEAPTFIREMPLLELSREASFMYALDFRMGKNIYSRGGLMAAEMDDRIRSRTSGKRSLRDSLRFLLDWTERNQRAFETQELGRLLSQSAGVDVQDILARWMKANPRPLD